jgi:biopolymer transport protein TolR
MAMQGQAERRMMSEINVTPFVDVMLVLLVIFMVTAPMMQAGVAVQLPRVGASPLPAQERSVVITVDGKLIVHVASKSFTPAEFALRAPEIFAEMKDRPFYLRGDERVPYGVLMGVLSALKKAGVERVGLVTEPSS